MALIRDISLLLAGLLIGGMAVWALGRDSLSAPPRAAGWCDPVVGLVGEPMVCHDLSRAADGTRWLFGDGSPARRHPPWESRIEHVYESPGRYLVRQEAISDGAIDARRFEITVTAAQRLPAPVTVSIQAVLSNDQVVVTSTKRLREIQAPNTERRNSLVQSYEKRFPAKPGFKITGASLRLRATSGMTNFRSAVSPDGSEVIIRFTLRSGPRDNPNKAWLIGDLVVTEEGREDDRRFEVMRDLRLDRTGRYSVDRIDLDDIFELRVLDADGTILGRGLPGEMMVLRGLDLGLQIEQRANRTVLDLSLH